MSDSIIDAIAKMLAGGCPVDTALAVGRSLERRLLKDAADGRRATAVINKRRVWDKNRKKRTRVVAAGMSTGQAESTLPSSFVGRTLLDLRKKEGSASGGHPPAKHSRAVGQPLPAEWQPSEGHFLECERTGAPRSVCDEAHAAMRNWTLAEAHRAVSKKSNWDATFLNTWLLPAIRRWKKDHGGGPRRKSFGDVFMGRE